MPNPMFQLNLKSVFAIALLVAILVSHILTMSAASFLAAGAAIVVLFAIYGNGYGRPVSFATLAGALWPAAHVLVDGAQTVAAGEIVQGQLYYEDGPVEFFAATSLILLLTGIIGGLYGAVVGAVVGGFLRLSGQRPAVSDADAPIVQSRSEQE